MAATTPETLEMLDVHWQENGTSLLDVLDRLGQQSHGLPPFPRELVDQKDDAAEDRGRRSAQRGHDVQPSRERKE